MSDILVYNLKMDNNKQALYWNQYLSKIKNYYSSNSIYRIIYILYLLTSILYTEESAFITNKNDHELTATILWQKPCFAYWTQSPISEHKVPVILDNLSVLYIYNDQLYAVDSRTGDILWTYTGSYLLPLQRRWFGFFGPIIEIDDILYGFNTPKIEILDKDSGNLLNILSKNNIPLSLLKNLSRSISQTSIQTRITISQVFLGQYSPTLRVYNNDKENVLWTRNGKSFLCDELGLNVYMVNRTIEPSSALLQAIDITTGHEQWNHLIEDYIIKPVLSDSNNLYVQISKPCLPDNLCEFTELMCFNKYSGEVRWKQSGVLKHITDSGIVVIDEYYTIKPKKPEKNSIQFFQEQIFDKSSNISETNKNVIYNWDSRANIRLIDKQTGENIKTLATHVDPNQNILFTDEFIFYSKDSMGICIDTETGFEKWRINNYSNIHSNGRVKYDYRNKNDWVRKSKEALRRPLYPLVSENILLITIGDEKFIAIDVKNGTIVWELLAPKQFISQATVKGKTVAIITTPPPDPNAWVDMHDLESMSREPIEVLGTVFCVRWD